MKRIFYTKIHTLALLDDRTIINIRGFYFYETFNAKAHIEVQAYIGDVSLIQDLTTWIQQDYSSVWVIIDEETGTMEGIGHDLRRNSGTCAGDL